MQLSRKNGSISGFLQETSGKKRVQEKDTEGRSQHSRARIALKRLMRVPHEMLNSVHDLAAVGDVRRLEPKLQRPIYA